MEFIFLSLHLLSLAFTVVGIALSDKQAFAWLGGKAQTLDPALLKKYHRWVGLGLALMIATGLMLFYPQREKLLNNNPFFLAKMLAVALLVINVFVIGRFMKVATLKPYASLSAKEKIPLFLSGAISVGCWFSAATLAFFILD